MMFNTKKHTMQEQEVDIALKVGASQTHRSPYGVIKTVNHEILLYEKVILHTFDVFCILC